MILEIDMGNTRLKWRIRDRQSTLGQGALPIEDFADLMVAEIEPNRSAISAVWVVSVVGHALEQKLIDWSVAQLELAPVFARSSPTCGLVQNGYLEPQALGADRWLGIVAAYHQSHRACLVVSCGTAVTVDLVTVDGRHMGGFIAPGLKLMLDSLTAGTRQIKLGSQASVLGLSAATSTSDAVYKGCAAMLVGLIDNAMQEMRKPDQSANIEMIFTGGDADKILPFFPLARLAPQLVLDGLAYVLDYPKG